jgi:hypothetical protein
MEGLGLGLSMEYNSMKRRMEERNRLIARRRKMGSNQAALLLGLSWMVRSILNLI